MSSQRARWLTIAPVLGCLWMQLPSRLLLGHQLESLFRETVSVKPSLVVVSPVALALQTHTHSDGLRQVVDVAGLDAAGCIRYAGSTEVLRAHAGPVYVYLLPLPARICTAEPLP